MYSGEGGDSFRLCPDFEGSREVFFDARIYLVLTLSRSCRHNAVEMDDYNPLASSEASTIARVQTATNWTFDWLQSKTTSTRLKNRFVTDDKYCTRNKLAHEIEKHEDLTVLRSESKQTVLKTHTVTI